MISLFSGPISLVFSHYSCFCISFSFFCTLFFHTILSSCLCRPFLSSNLSQSFFRTVLLSYSFILFRPALSICFSFYFFLMFFLPGLYPVCSSVLLSCFLSKDFFLIFVLVFRLILSSGSFVLFFSFFSLFVLFFSSFLSVLLPSTS
jgi:hypothetical protein